ncbi:MAG: sulfatase-like hydrolase/transferase, partial [bacterium]
YPREHHVYGFKRPLYPEVPTLADIFGSQGYHTILMNGLSIFSKNGIEQRFDETIKGPLKRLSDRIQECNNNGTPVFAYYHTMDVHHPYLLSKYPVDTNHHKQAKAAAQDLSNELEKKHHFQQSDLMKKSDIEGVQWEAGRDCLLWDYIHGLYHIHMKRDQNFEAPLQKAAELYVKGINVFDRKQLAPFVSFLRETDAGQRTTFLLTSDHGESPRFDGDLVGFEHSFYPKQDLIRVPAVLYNVNKDTSGIQEWSLTSLVDIAPTLLEEFGINSTPRMSGHNLFSQPQSREVFSEYSDDQRSGEAADFPREAVLIWSVIITDEGDKFARSGLKITERDYDLPTKLFVERVFLKIALRQPEDEELDRVVDQLKVEDSRSRRESFVDQIKQQTGKPRKCLVDWTQDHYEKNNLLEEEHTKFKNLAETLEGKLLSRFPDYLELKTPYEDKQTDEEELKPERLSSNLVPVD